jgi:phosphopantothenoylcysteine decarboxylase/phosphopantothenate--cysteine ligase
MGQALAEAALRAGHEVLIVSGPVEVRYPPAARVIRVVSTEELLAECLAVFPRCSGLIAVAAPCDYRPQAVAPRKIRKTGDPLTLRLVETPDVVARLGQIKTAQWMVAFALETEDRHLRAQQKLERKRCDLVVVNGPAAIDSPRTRLEVLDPAGRILAEFAGGKRPVARNLFSLIEQRLIAKPKSRSSKCSIDRA